MKIMGYEIVLEIDGVESMVKLDDTYPAINNWHTATEVAIRMVENDHPDVKNIDFVECVEYEMEEYEKYPYIHEAPCILQ
jgi:hypothetical protein